MAASKDKKKASTRPPSGRVRDTRKRAPKKPSRKASLAAKKGWETRRRKARASELEKARRAKERERAKAKRAPRDARYKRRKLAKERLRGAFESFVQAVQDKARNREIQVLRDVYHREKAATERAMTEGEYGDFEAYIEFLDELADDSGTDWDIAYASPSAQGAE